MELGGSIPTPDISLAVAGAENDEEHLLHFPSGDKPVNTWIIDSGASVHVVSDLSLFTKIYDRVPDIKVRVANGKLCEAQHIGEVEIPMVDEQGNTKMFTLKNVLYLPSINVNVISCSKMWKQHRLKTVFGGDNYFRSLDRKKYHFSESRGGYYHECNSLGDVEHSDAPTSTSDSKHCGKIP